MPVNLGKCSLEIAGKSLVRLPDWPYDHKKNSYENHVHGFQKHLDTVVTSTPA